MSQPHHFLFNELQRAIQKCVPVDPLIPFLLEKNVIKKEDIAKYTDPKVGMKRLTSSLRNKDFDTFVKFVDCICAAGYKDPSVKLSIVSSIRSALEVFDKDNNTSFASRISGLKQQQEPESLLPPPESMSETTAAETAGAEASTPTEGLLECTGPEQPPTHEQIHKEVVDPSSGTYFFIVSEVHLRLILPTLKSGVKHLEISSCLNSLPHAKNLP